jgi:L-lactate dehydrogenase complex protein LldG
MTNPVIENVRRSLGRTVSSPVGPRPAVVPPRQPGSIDSEIGRFFDELGKLTGVGQTLTPAGVAEALKTLAVEQKIRKAALWHTPFLEELKIAGVLKDAGVEVAPFDADKQALAGCDLGITEADYLLPETGTIVLTSSADKPRAVSLLPRIHLAVARPEELRPDLHQVFAEGKTNPYMVFITGPSRTADIELTTTIGVHGPKQLFVWMMRE